MIVIERLQNADPVPFIVDAFEHKKAIKLSMLIVFLVLYFKVLVKLIRTVRFKYFILAVVLYICYIEVDNNYDHICNAIKIQNVAHGSNITILNNVEKINATEKYNQYIISALIYKGKIYAQTNITRLDEVRPKRTKPSTIQAFMPWDPLSPIPVSEEKYYALLIATLLINMLAIYAILTFKNPIENTVERQVTCI